MGDKLVYIISRSTPEELGPSPYFKPVSKRLRISEVALNRGYSTWMGSERKKLGWGAVGGVIF